MTVSPFDDMSDAVDLASSDGSEGAEEDKAAGVDKLDDIACAATVEGAAEPVMVSTPESLDDALASELTDSTVEVSVLGGTTIVAVASEELVVATTVWLDVEVVVSAVVELVSSGGNGDAAIDERPFWISEVVNVLCESVDEAVTVDSTLVFTGIDVKPCAMVSVFTIVNESTLELLDAVSLVLVAAALEVLTGTELSPFTTSPVVVCNVDV